MKRLVFLLGIGLGSQVLSQSGPVSDLAMWEMQAARVTIVRDDWGIAHVFGKSDADAVFGMIYAQAEDDFNRIETNYLTQLGRLAEAEGESRLYQDLRMRLFNDQGTLELAFRSAPVSLQRLMRAWADALNYFLATHPAVKPRVITRFLPWMALSFTEGSIGGDIEKINLGELQAFYGKGSAPVAPLEPVEVEDELFREPSGSNGAAIAPANTVSHHALLLINPHTTFFFRSELQMVSEEGLNAYGAATWGQFFIYQGFNSRVGWMHTTSAVDDLDEYLETVTKKDNGYVYKHGSDELPVAESALHLLYKSPAGPGQRQRSFTIYRTMHGPVVRAVGDKWVSFSIMTEPIKALTQSYTRTKATDYKSFRQSMELHTNSSNNTIFASAGGDIAYFHGNFIPRRDPAFDWTKPVDGSNPATDWKGLLSVDESPTLLNPSSGWLYNSNNWPWSAAGPSSQKKADFPVYVDSGSESARGLHAVRVLQNKKDFTLDGLIAAAYDSYLTWFEKPMPALIKAWDAAPASHPLKAKLADQIALLRGWDLRWSATSIPTSLAIFWGAEVQRRVTGARGSGMPQDEYIATRGAADDLLGALSSASDRLATDFGSWKTPWGDINRFQRLTDDIVHPFSDAGPSIPVGFPSATWGSLASFGARAHPGTKKWYGTSGNSFVAVVEFGDTVRAKAVTAGGESGDVNSKHFNDQAMRYSTGGLRDVYFYRDQLKGHTDREYHPGK
jgi:acyl-homoserine lactone acylase PvdQ